MVLGVMARELDVIVLGASGFTGVQVCLHLARQIKSSKGGSEELSWGIAGRRRDRMESLLLSRLREEGLQQPQMVFEVDNFDDAQLREVVSRCRLLLNCTGPYRFLGEPVVHACIDSGTDYMDLCGEPEFMDRIKLKLGDQAEAAGVLVIHACAFDSVPADLGTVFLCQQFGPLGIVSSVESFLSFEVGPHGLVANATTFQAAVHGFGAVKDLKRVRAELREKYPQAPAIPRTGPRPNFPSRPSKVTDAQVPGAYLFKFPGADAAVVRSSQASLTQHLGEHQAKRLCPYYGAFFTVPSFTAALKVALFGSVFSLLAKSERGRSLLLNHVGLFSNGVFSEEGPSQEQLEGASFAMTFVGRGYSEDHTAPQDGGEDAPFTHRGPTDKTVHTVVSGPEPGYVATPKIFLTLARTLLKARGEGPGGGGQETPGGGKGLLLSRGCCTPGAVFDVTPSLLQDLKDTGIEFRVLDD